MSKNLVDTFYGALAEHDGEAMAACYHENIVFEDPAFGVLTGKDAGDMWRMLCATDTDLTVTHTVLEATPTTATTNWIATYTFTTTGRPVRNDVTARMTILDDKIVDHRDTFDFWKWSSQALGTTGKLLGWSPFLKAKVRTTTRQSLDKYQADNS
ncbi:nuclear transport factor 2 family protein [soil metagenome]